MWIAFALLSAFFAAMTSIFAKIGIEGINSNLATAIRTIVVLIMAWAIVFITGTQSQVSGISTKSWIFLILSGFATGFSWLFYYKALQIGEASKVICRLCRNSVPGWRLSETWFHCRWAPAIFVQQVVAVMPEAQQQKAASSLSPAVRY